MALRLVAATVVALALHSADASNEDVACASDAFADVRCATSTSAALLQTGFKHTHTQEQAPPTYDCTGADQQGRCWFLSELGETCMSTCARQGRSFSYAIADPERPLMPTLVNHQPKLKQEAWAALECYVPGEDRYHTANENAARHFSNDIGNWSHESCKLACPCGEVGSDRCVWKQAAGCVSQFMFRGVEYSGCATVDPEHETPWCQHQYQHTDKDDANLVKDWSSCTYTCEDEVPARPVVPVEPTRPIVPVEPTRPSQDAECGWSPAPSCVNEFNYEGNQYVGCTGADHDKKWCSNSDPYLGSWDYCTYTCTQKPNPVVPVVPVVPIVPVMPVDQSEECTWQPALGCSATFQYKGADYTGCTDMDHPAPWCSRDRVHTEAWYTCTRVCQRPVAPVPVPQPTPTGEDTICARHPEVEKDSIGNAATLDEVGYHITASAESPINMKRFVCRVVAKIGCKVTDQASLLGFVPFYSGIVAHQTYRNLEYELTTLCHAGGRWVQFRQP